MSQYTPMVIDFGRTRIKWNTISILGEEVEVVEGYRYLGVHLDNRLDWKCNTEAVYRKGQSRLYFLRKLRSFNVCRNKLRVFWQSVVASAILFEAICRGSSIRARDSKKLKKMMKAGSVLGTALETLELVVERRMLCKLLNIMGNTTYPLNNNNLYIL